MFHVFYEVLHRESSLARFARNDIVDVIVLSAAKHQESQCWGKEVDSEEIVILFFI